MKVLYLINYAGKGGTEKYVRDLVSAYHADKAECFFAYNIDGPLVQQMKDKGIECLNVEMKSAYDIKAAKKIAAFCKKNNIDIIHTQFPRENYIAVLSKLFYNKVRLFNTSHLIMIQGGIWRIVNKLLSRFDEKVFAVCNCGKQTLIENGVSKNKIEVVFNGIPLKQPKKNTKVRNELGISDDTFVISSLTRYTSEKGLPFLVDTVSELSKITDRKFAVLIAGDGEMYGEISDKIKGLSLEDIIYQLGYRNDASDILASSDLFLNLSSTEALSFAILEALGSGVPVIATNVGGTSDIINDKNQCGVLVEYNNPKQASAAIKKLIDDQNTLSELSDNALKTVSENFDISIMLDIVYKQYEESLK